MPSACRLLCFKLTDGNKSCKALEFRPIQGAESDSIAPGAKVLIAGATVKAGIILVDAKSLEVCHQAFHSKATAGDRLRQEDGEAA